MNRNLTALSLMTLLLAACVPGCLFSSEAEYTTCSDDDNCLKIAFEVKEEYQNTDENPQKLGDRLGELMGQEVEIYPVASAAATIEALRFGNADIGFLDGGAAWLSWNEYGLQVAAAEQKADGRAYYHAVAWVHKDSDMAQASMNGDVDQALTLMEGKTKIGKEHLFASLKDVMERRGMAYRVAPYAPPQAKAKADVYVQ